MSNEQIPVVEIQFEKIVIKPIERKLHRAWKHRQRIKKFLKQNETQSPE